MSKTNYSNVFSFAEESMRDKVLKMLRRRKVGQHKRYVAELIKKVKEL
jgi:hypothetical protein